MRTEGEPRGDDDGTGDVPLPDLLVLAVWTGAVTGWLEGLQLAVSRAWPTVLAPYKASVHLLWLSPLVDMATFTFAGASLWSLWQVLPRATRLRRPHVVYGLFVAGGAVTVGMTLRVLHWASCVLLALGAGIALGRPLARGGRPRIASLRRRLWWLPTGVVACALALMAWQWAQERWQATHLPPVGTMAGAP